MREVLTYQYKKQKRRAIELYDADSPFKARIEVSKRRKELTKPKYPNNWKDEL